MHRERDCCSSNTPHLSLIPANHQEVGPDPPDQPRALLAPLSPLLRLLLQWSPWNWPAAYLKPWRKLTLPSGSLVPDRLSAFPFYCCKVFTSIKREFCFPTNFPSHQKFWAEFWNMCLCPGVTSVPNIHTDAWKCSHWGMVRPNKAALQNEACYLSNWKLAFPMEFSETVMFMSPFKEETTLVFRFFFSVVPDCSIFGKQPLKFFLYFHKNRSFKKLEGNNENQSREFCVLLYEFSTCVDLLCLRPPSAPGSELERAQGKVSSLSLNSQCQLPAHLKGFPLNNQSSVAPEACASQMASHCVLCHIIRPGHRPGPHRSPSMSLPAATWSQ